jgi:Tol biopolymer transport system component
LTTHPADDAVASWSRDGRWIYFGSNRTKDWQIWKMPANGGEALQVTRHGGWIAFESLDGMDVYFSKNTWLSDIWKVPVSGGEETKVVESVQGNAFAMTSKGIYFVGLHSGGRAVEFYSFAANKVAAVATIHRPVSWGLSVSPDERFILYTQVDEASRDLMLVENFR